MDCRRSFADDVGNSMSHLSSWMKTKSKVSIREILNLNGEGKLSQQISTKLISSSAQWNSFMIFFDDHDLFVFHQNVCFFIINHDNSWSIKFTLIWPNVARISEGVLWDLERPGRSKRHRSRGVFGQKTMKNDYFTAANEPYYSAILGTVIRYRIRRRIPRKYAPYTVTLRSVFLRQIWRR